MLFKRRRTLPIRSLCFPSSMRKHQPTPAYQYLLRYNWMIAAEQVLPCFESRRKGTNIPWRCQPCKCRSLAETSMLPFFPHAMISIGSPPLLIQIVFNSVYILTLVILWIAINAETSTSLVKSGVCFSCQICQCLGDFLIWEFKLAASGCNCLGIYGGPMHDLAEAWSYSKVADASSPQAVSFLPVAVSHGLERPQWSSG